MAEQAYAADLNSAARKGIRVRTPAPVPSNSPAAPRPRGSVLSVDQLGALIGVAIFYGLIFGLGEWFFRVLADRLDARLQAGWRWMTLPIVAILSFAGFLVLRPLILDQPRTPVWFAMALIAVALLVTGATALAYAGIALGRWFLAVLRSR